MAENKRPESMQRITTPELAQAFIDEQLTALREQIGNKKVLLALSGGVDSSVVAALLIKAVGKQLTCVHVNHGLLRKGEPEQVIEVFRNQMDANLIYVAVSWTSWPVLRTPRPSVRSSGKSLSMSLLKKPINSMGSASWPRAPSILTSSRAGRSSPTTTLAACPKI